MATVARRKAEDEARDMGGWPWRWEFLNLDECYLDRYQRPLNEPWISARKDRFNPALFQCITANAREREEGELYAVVDGQHRCVLAKEAGIVKPVPACVFYDLTPEQEAELFSLFQRERRSITPMQRFHADVFAGLEEALAIERICDAIGYTLSEAGDSEPGIIKAVVSLERIYRTPGGPAFLSRVLNLLYLTWGKMPGSANEKTIRGVEIFLRKYPELDEDRFIAKLSLLTPSDVVRNAAKLRDVYGHSGPVARYVAEVIENAYQSKGR
jgi:hypothetical protein